MLLTMGGCEGPRDGFRLRLSDPTLGHVLSTNNYHGSEDSEEESSVNNRVNNWPRNCPIPVSMNIFLSRVKYSFVTLIMGVFTFRQI